MGEGSRYEFADLLACHCEPLMVEYEGIETQRRSNLLFEERDCHAHLLRLGRNDIFQKLDTRTYILLE